MGVIVLMESYRTKPRTSCPEAHDICTMVAIDGIGAFEQLDPGFNYSKGLHAPFRESQVAALLEEYQILPTFSDSTTLALYSDKEKIKVLEQSLAVVVSKLSHNHGWFWIIISFQRVYASLCPGSATLSTTAKSTSDFITPIS